MSSGSDFIHLHLHSQYSLLDGAVRLSDLIAQAKALGMPAVAVTDHGNMFGAFDFHKQAIAGGIKAIIGSEVYVAPGDRRDRKQRNNYHLILLARNDEGYRNLTYLVSMGFIEGFYYRPRIDKELLRERSAGLIGATACLGGEVATAFRTGGYEAAKATARSLADLFEPGCFFLEVQNNGYDGQEAYNNALRRAGQELSLPLLATNDVHYLKAEDAKAHHVLMCIQKGVTLKDAKTEIHYTDQLFLRTADELKAALPDFPDAIENSLKVSEMCEHVNPARPTSWPDFPVPANTSQEEYLRKLAHAGLNRRFEEFDRISKTVDKAAYRKRLDEEVDIICQMKFPGYFLVVKDFIGFARDSGIPVGPGRGSGAGSLVAFALRITNFDPIPLGLLFERFLNPERRSMPDFDVDFCKNRREEVIAYVVEKYGRDNVGQIATFHQLKSRSAVRDVGRAMGMATGDIDRIAKLVPEGPEVTLGKALKTEPRLRDARKSDPRVDELLSYAERLESLHRHAGMHAGGVVIGKKPLWEYVPVFKGSDRDQVTHLVSQFDMHFVEHAGLIKFDFLGLKTLTVIDTAIKLLRKRPDSEGPLDLDQLDLRDPEVYRLISSGNTWGVFQLESQGFQELLRRLQPDCFEDIVAANALYRPGPIEGGMTEQFVECKHGHQEIRYLHPRLRPILEETYGVIVYQEQVMQIAQTLAGYTLGAADEMRRAMGKKEKQRMANERLTFVAGAERNGVEAALANEIFSLMEKFAEYGFNKSHSAAYALVTYQTAWLKVHYPAEFEAALLTCDQEETDKVSRYIRAGKGLGVEVLPPDINRSESAFTVIYGKDPSDAKILFGLGAIKGVGASALAAVFEARSKGDFLDLFDFTSRVDLSKVNKAVIESLIRAGAFDGLTRGEGINRGQIFGALDTALERGRAAQRDRETGQTSLFGPSGILDRSAPASPGGPVSGYREFPPWSEPVLLAQEKAAIGLYMSGHPMERYADEAARRTDCNTATVASRGPGDAVTIAGMVMDFAEKTTRSGKRLATFALEDLEGRCEVVVYSEALSRFSALIPCDDPLFVSGTVRVDRRGDEESKSIVLNDAMPLKEVRARRTREVRLHLDGGSFPLDRVDELKAVLEQHPGRCDAFIDVLIPDHSVTTIALPEQYRVAPTDELVLALEAIGGVGRVEFR